MKTRTSRITLERIQSRYFSPIPPKPEKTLKKRILQRLEENLVLFEYGDSFNCSQLFGHHWHNIDLSLRIRVGKEFKILISEKKIRGLSYSYYKNGKIQKRQNSIVYTRRSNG